mgnify:CR=1 FL=1
MSQIPTDVWEIVIASYLDLEDLEDLAMFHLEYHRRLQHLRNDLLDVTRTTGTKLLLSKNETCKKHIEYLVSIDNPKILDDLLGTLERSDRRTVF